MKRNHWLFFVVFCLLYFQGVAWCKGEAVASLTAGNGAIQVRRVGATASAALPLRAPLFAGDVVTTGPNGYAKVVYDDGSNFKMGPNGRVEITALAKAAPGTSLFRALAGEIWARLRPGRGAKTVYTNLVVRGTEFDVLIGADGSATLTVIEGEVEFSNQFGLVRVGASQQSVARVGQAPTKPVTIPNAGFIVEWTLDLENRALPHEVFFQQRDRAKARQLAANATGDTLGTADLLFDAGQYEAALARYQKLNTPQANLRAATALRELGRLDEAETAFRALNNGATAGEAAPGLAWTLLARGRAAEAQAVLDKAPATSESRLALGAALLRQGKASDAENALRPLVDAAWPGRYQARSWLALSKLARSQNGDALREARASVQEAPTSGMAQAVLATVAFFAGESAEASRAARRAVAIDPDSAASQLVLAQAHLATGDVDAAAIAAACAVALDDKSPEALYVLGVADAGRRDYRHAVPSLEKALSIAPQFLPAAAALSRVYIRMGRAELAQKQIEDYEKTHGRDYQTVAARGEVLYAVGDYPAALAAYREAIKLRPDSAASQAGLARVAIDANRLFEAIDAAQKAVQLAPDVAAYHAILGLAYDFSRMPRQAEREFRTALTLDPQNALALVQLGRMQKDGDARTIERVAAVSFAQGYILAPDISKELLRGGISSQLGAQGGNKNYAGWFSQRAVGDAGKLNFFADGTLSSDGGDRPNSDNRTTTIAQNTTYQLDNRTTLLAHYLHRRNDLEIPGTLTAPAVDDKGETRFHQAMIAARRRLNGRAHLWGSLFASNHRDRRVNPDNSFTQVFAVRGGFSFNVNELLATTKSEALAPELRFDYDLSGDPARRSRLTFGYARPRAVTSVRHEVSSPNDPGDPPFEGTVIFRQSAPFSILYGEWNGEIGNRLSLTAQVRRERQKRTVSAQGGLGAGGAILDFTAPPTTTAPERILPSLIANYRASRSTNVRFFANRTMTDVQGSLLAPPTSLITTEGDALPLGLPDPSLNGDLHSYQVDIERYWGRGGLLKLFAFRTTGRGVTYDFSRYANPADPDLSGLLRPGFVTFDTIRRSGAGVRIEHPLRPGLFGNAGLVLNNTNATSTVYNPQSGFNEPAPFNGQTAPYHPKFVANIGVNYVSPRGFKAGVQMNYTGAYFADAFDPFATVRPRIGGAPLFDFKLAKETSVRSEVFLQVYNAFDRQQFVFNDIPLNGRRIVAGVVRRF